MEIRFDHVSKRYGDKTVLSGLDWRVQAGETWRVEGPSGAGKTTLLRLLLGLEHPSAGRIDRPHGVRFAPVFQENRLIPRLSAVQNIALTCDAPDDKICTALAEVGLTADDLAQAAATLSGGMQRRAAIVRALLVPSDFLVLDEPFSGLDPDNIARVLACIDRRRASRGLIFVSHERYDAFSGAKCLRLP